MSTFGKPVTAGLDETLRPALMGVVLNLLRTSTLGTKVAIDQVVSFVSSSWKEMYQPGVFDLGPLHRMVLGKPGVTHDDAAEVFLLLKQRESRLGLTIKLPPSVEALPAAERDRLLGNVQKVGVQSGVTLSGRRGQAQPEHPAEGLVDRVRAILNSTPPRKP